MKNNKTLITILVCFALVLSLATGLPFSLSTVNNTEWIIKFIVIPVIIIIISLISFVQCIKRVEDNKYEFLGFVLPIVTYITSSLIFNVTIALRSGTGSWINDLTSFLVLCVIFMAVSLITVLKKQEDSKKNNTIFIAITLLVLLIVQLIYNNLYIQKYLSEELIKDNQLIFYCALVINLLYIVTLFVLFFIAKKKIINQPNKNINIDDFELQKMDYLLNLHKYTKEALESYGYEFPIEKEVQIVEVEKEVIKEVEVEKIVEVIKEVEVEKIVEVEKEPVLIPVVAPKEPKPVKEKKVIEPSVAELAEYITANFPDANIVYGKNENNYKVFRNKKLMLVVQSSANDYKIMFQRKPISVAKLLIKYPNVIIKATNPVGEQWFKVTNKGNVDAEDLKTIIKFSHKYLVDEEAKELAKKEKQKAKIQAKKDAEKAKIKAKKEAEKAKIKAKKEAEKAKLKAKEEAEKAKLKAKE